MSKQQNVQNYTTKSNKMIYSLLVVAAAVALLQPVYAKKGFGKKCQTLKYSFDYNDGFLEFDANFNAKFYNAFVKDTVSNNVTI
jgi:hypothetical protein